MWATTADDTATTDTARRRMLRVAPDIASHESRLISVVELPVTSRQYRPPTFVCSRPKQRPTIIPGQSIGLPIQPVYIQPVYRPTVISGPRGIQPAYGPTMISGPRGTQPAYGPTVIPGPRGMHQPSVGGVQSIIVSANDADDQPAGRQRSGSAHRA